MGEEHKVEKQKQLKAINGQIDDILSFESDELGMSPELGAVNFKDHAELFASVFTFIRELKGLPLSIMPAQGINWSAQAGSLASVATVVKQISEFSLTEGGEPQGKRDALATQLENNLDKLVVTFMPHLPYLTLKQFQVVEVVEQSQTLLRETKNDFEEVRGYIQQEKEEIDDIVQTAREVASSIGASKFALAFGQIADDHEESSKTWLWWTIGLAIVSIVSAICVIYFVPLVPGELINSEASLFPFVLTKIVLVSMFFFITFWAGRNYSAHRHLTVVNRHRQNSLDTFETFVKGSDNPTIKDAVLLEATKCIFTPVASAYLGRQSQPPTNQVFEIFKKIGGSA